jgi:hypothetical protein
VSDNGSDLREQHLGELVGRLAADTSTLVRQEMELARAELRERVDAIRADVTEAIALARSETTEKLDQAKADVADRGRKAGVGIGMFGAAGVATLLCLGALTAALVLLLNRWLDADLAALVVGVAWALVAAAAALRGRGKVHEATDLQPSRYVPRQTLDTVKDDLKRLGDADRLKPEHTIETVKEDVEWAKTRGRSDAR